MCLMGANPLLGLLEGLVHETHYCTYGVSFHRMIYVHPVCAAYWILYTYLHFKGILIPTNYVLTVYSVDISKSTGFSTLMIRFFLVLNKPSMEWPVGGSWLPLPVYRYYADRKDMSEDVFPGTLQVMYVHTIPVQCTSTYTEKKKLY